MKLRKSKNVALFPQELDIKLSNSLLHWFLLQTILLMAVGGLTGLIIQWAVKQIFETPEHDLATIAITVASVVFVIGFFVLIEYRLLKRHLEKICDVIDLLAHGEYGRKIKIGKFTIFKNLANNVNLLSEELEQVQMLRNDFVNSYSHEFKTPIASINGFAQLLINDDSLDCETRKKYLQIIVDESERLSALSGNTILLSQLDTQKIVSDKKLYSLDEQLRRCVIMFSNEWMAKNISVTGEGIEEISYFGDENLMQHLWLNLLQNAIKFTPEGGSITVSAKEENGRIYVHIADTGIGMAPESAQRIFDKYYRENNSSNCSGLGLGLSIANKIVKLCAGKISVESLPGKGSVFTVELPK